MKVEIKLTDDFHRAAKKLLKKYRSLNAELQTLATALKENPRMGTLIAENIYKIRLAVKSKGGGKSGGMRIVTYVHAIIVESEEDIQVYLLTIYDKAEFDTVSDEYLKSVIEAIQQILQSPVKEEEE